MKTESNRKDAIPQKAGEEGKTHIEQSENEVEKTSGERKNHPSPIPDADQHRSKDFSDKPQKDERDTA